MMYMLKQREEYITQCRDNKRGDYKAQGDAY